MVAEEARLTTRFKLLSPRLAGQVERHNFQDTKKDQHRAVSQKRGERGGEGREGEKRKEEVLMRDARRLRAVLYRRKRGYDAVT